MLRINPGFILAVVILAVFLVYLAALSNGVPTQATDWAMYVMHARNILHGRPYAETGYVVQPETTYEGGNSYPSGFALMLVPFYAVFGLDTRVFKIVCDALLALSLWPIYIFSRRYLPPSSSLLIVLATTFSWEYVLVQNLIGSDQLYQLLSFLAIVFVLSIYDRGKDVSRGWLWGGLAGLMIAAAYLTRPIGLALALAVAIVEVVRKRRITAFIAAMACTFAASLVLNNLAFHKDSSYKSQFTLSPVLIASHAVVYVGYLSHIFANPLSMFLRHVLWVPSLLLAVLGISTKVRRTGLTLVEVYWVVSLGGLSAYWLPNTRYLMPLLPIYLVYMFIGAEAALEYAPEKYRFALRFAAAAALMIAPVINLALIRTINQDTLVATRSFDQLCRQIETTTGPDEYVLFWNPRVLALYTGRRSSPYPLAEPLQVEHFVDRVQPNYIVSDKTWEGDQKYLAPVLDTRPQRYTTIYENEQFKLTQVSYAPDRRAYPPAPVP